MDEITTREKILNRIREALTNSPMDNPYPSIDLDESITAEMSEFSDTLFAENFVRRGGRFVYCESVDVAVRSLHIIGNQEDWSGNLYCGEEEIAQLLEAAGLSCSGRKEDAVVKKIGCCSCRYLLAQTGSVVFDASTVGRKLYASADVMVFFATVDQIGWDLKSAFKDMRKFGNLSSMTTIWTGLSKMTDIDGVDRKGFGPEKVIVFLIDSVNYVEKDAGEE